LILNVAAGGVNGYFPDGQTCKKPWSNDGAHAVNDFYNQKSEWFPSWNYPASHDAAMKVDHIKVWQDDGTGKAKEEEVFLQN
jgi:hypothetical protein